jgi:hypothetical protein
MAACNEPFDERVGTPMSEKDHNIDGLKSLLQKWNNEFDEFPEIRNSDDAMKDLKQRLEDTWNVFEQRFKKN